MAKKVVGKLVDAWRPIEKNDGIFKVCSGGNLIQVGTVVSHTSKRITILVVQTCGSMTKHRYYRGRLHSTDTWKFCGMDVQAHRPIVLSDGTLVLVDEQP